jgi:hypothetical protein
MSWKKLLQENKVHRHRTSIQELTEIRRLVARDLADAAIPALSEDRRLPLHITLRCKPARWPSHVPDTESPVFPDIID